MTSNTDKITYHVHNENDKLLVHMDHKPSQEVWISKNKVVGKTANLCISGFSGHFCNTQFLSRPIHCSYKFLSRRRHSVYTQVAISPFKFKFSSLDPGPNVGKPRVTSHGSPAFINCGPITPRLCLIRRVFIEKVFWCIYWTHSNQSNQTHPEI